GEQFRREHQTPGDRERRQHAVISLVRKQRLTDERRYEADNEHRYADREKLIREQRPPVLLDGPHRRIAADDELREQDGERQQPGDAADGGALDRIGTTVGEEAKIEKLAKEMASEVEDRRQGQAGLARRSSPAVAGAKAGLPRRSSRALAGAKAG